MTLLIVRHGETAWNAEGRLQGHTDVPLSAAGREQAHRLARRFSAATTAHAPHSRLRVLPQAVFTSDLSRAIETAAIVSRGYSLPESRIFITESLRERGFGPWEGLTLQEAQLKFGLSRSHRNEGEPTEDVRTRMGMVLREIWDVGTSEGTADGCVLVVGHGGSLRELVCLAIGQPSSCARHFHLDNTGLSIVELQGPSQDRVLGRVLLWNDVAHLFYADTFD